MKKSFSHSANKQQTVRVVTMGFLSMFTFLAHAQYIEATLKLMQPGNKAVSHQLELQGDRYVGKQKLPLVITRTVSKDGNDDVVTIRVKADKTVYFNFGAKMKTGLSAADNEYYLPGFWYHKNLRSPKEAPSFATSQSWNFRDDRLSTPLTSVYNAKLQQAVSVLHIPTGSADVQMQLLEGDVILGGETSVGYLGFDNSTGETSLTFGYPYDESPRRYIRKLTLAPAVTAYAMLKQGEEKTLTWRIHRDRATSYGDFVTRMWQYSFDMMKPQPLANTYSADEVKVQLCGYFRDSYVDKYALKYNSGHTILTYDCTPSSVVQIGFCGRVLLNAFNEIEWGETHGDTQLVKMGESIIESYLHNGFTPAGYFYDDVNFAHGMPRPQDVVHSIRQQSEAIYAILHWLKYERGHKRQHKEWEQKVRHILDNFLLLQKQDGSFARKYKDDGTDVDASGGSTPSATSTLVMGWKYFGDKRYLVAAKRTVDYVERNIISPSDYFSSTLDANCEDKEAAIAAVTSTYYLAMITKGKERAHYVDLCRKAAYFAVSWYYTWDVPFAQGQMLGDVDFHSRGWGNVSVENNHVDVFVFELPHILKWLADETGESRFEHLYDVMRSSLCQLMPSKEHQYNVERPGYYPEVVQHTTWDYGRNGKGFYNNYFAPGWTVASLWELYSPERTVNFLK